MEAIHSHPSPPNVHKAHLMVTEQYNTSISWEANEVLHPLPAYGLNAGNECLLYSTMDLKLYFYNAKIAF